MAGPDVIDVNLSRDDLVDDGDHDWGDERESVLRSLATRTRRWSAARSLVPESRFRLFDLGVRKGEPSAFLREEE